MWKINQEADNQTESTTAQTLEELIDDLVKQKLLTEDEKDQILGNDEKGIKATGQVTIGSRTIVFKTIEILAGDVFKINSDAEEEASKSPYVLYNNILCRVLYNDETHGLQIITKENLGENIILGDGDNTGADIKASDFTYSGSVTINDNFKIAAASYNNVIDNLNNKAKTYIDPKGIATDARSLGSIPTLASDSKFQKDTSAMWSGFYTYLETYSWNNKFKTSDTNYVEDVQQLNNLGLNVSSGYTWLASRYVDSSSSSTGFYVRNVNSSGSTLNNTLCYVTSGGVAHSNVPSVGFRPVFLIPSDVAISKGDGSSSNPYVIEE